MVVKQSKNGDGVKGGEEAVEGGGTARDVLGFGVKWQWPAGGGGACSVFLHQYFDV